MSKIKYVALAFARAALLVQIKIDAFTYSKAAPSRCPSFRPCPTGNLDAQIGGEDYGPDSIKKQGLRFTNHSPVTI
jgi:hypothetical protein